MPFASSSRQFAATMTQLIFASFAMHEASDFVSSDNSPASLILGVLESKVARSSRASLRSFHFDDFRSVCSEGDNCGTISTSSAKERGSGATASIFQLIKGKSN